MLGRQLVAYRTAAGKVVVMDGRCAHFGADLAGGRVVGDAIQCPYHNWEYGPDGRCTRIPGACGEIPRFARQTCYPAEERCGSIFFFNGPAALYPLPFFFDARPDELADGVPFQFIARCNWYLFASHAFDSQHFAAVHDRRLLGPPEIDCPAPFARRNHYTAMVEGSSIYDRLLRGFVGGRVEISITTWGGTLFFLTGRFRRALSRFLIAAQPLDANTTLAEGVVFTRRGRNPLSRALWVPLSLWVRRLFTAGYLFDEARRLGSPHYSPATMVEGDRDMIDFFHWLITLPQDAAGPRPSREEAGAEEGYFAPRTYGAPRAPAAAGGS
jgi:nitrite reductase/ring-hydroxylating ferredoxin subunit